MNKTLWLRLALVAVLVAGIALGVVYREHLSPENLETFIQSLGIWGPLVYIVIYLIAPVLFIPGSALTLAGGALFGPVKGIGLVLVGSVGGATLAFLIARYLAADWVERRTTGILRQVKEGVEEEGWRFVAFTRLVPLFPFSLLNYALGLTRIPLATYIWASAVFMLPGISGYVYLGYAGREALLGGEDALKKISWGVAIFAVLVFLPILVRRLRAGKKEKSRATDAAEEAETPLPSSDTQS